MDESLSSLSALSEVGMDDSVTQVLDQARECAVEKVVCPICFEALSDLPNQVGALTFEGKRVESALYHHDCVHNHATNRLVFASETGKAVSPLTRRQVDNFKVMPALTDSEEWVSFLDWNRTGHLDLQKVCFAVAALLPVDDAYARRFVLQVMNLPEDSEEAHEVSQQEVIQTLLPQIRRQLRRLVKTPRPRPPEFCRNSEKEELLAWFRFWDSKKEGRLDTSTLQLAVVATFHTALAKTADAATKAAIAQSFCTEMGLRECDHVTEEQFMEKMAPHLVSNLPVAIERNTRSSGFFDPKLSLTLHLRDMKSGAERPLYFETAGEVTVKDLKAATLRRFPVLLCRRTVKIFVMGQQLEDDFQPLFHLRGIYDGATVNFMAGQRVVETATKPKKKSPLDFDDLAGFDDASDSTSDEDLNRDLYEGNVRCLRQISNESAASRASRGSRLSVGSRPSQNSRRSDSSLKQHLDLAKKNAGKGSPTPSRMSQTSQGLSSPAPSQGPSPQPSPRPSKTRSDMAKSKDKVPSKEKKKEETQEVPVDWQVPECCNESDQAMIPYSRHCTLLGI